MTTPVVRELKRLSPHATRLVIAVAPPKAFDRAVAHAEAAAASAVLRVVGEELADRS